MTLYILKSRPRNWHTRHSILTFLLLVLVGIGGRIAWGRLQSSQTSPSLPTLIQSSEGAPSCAYLAPEEETIVGSSLRQRFGLTLVTNLTTLTQFLDAYPEITCLYFHPDRIEQVDEEWLRQQYRLGRVIVALMTPHNHLGNKLGVRPKVEDIRLDLIDREVYTYSAYWRSGVLNRTQRVGEATNYTPDFLGIGYAVVTILQN